MRESAVLAIALAAAACGYPRPADVGGEPRQLAGRVHGLWDGSDGVELELAAGALREAVTAGNGPLRFAAALDPDTEYEVRVTRSPRRHSCAVAAGATGTVGDGEPPALSIACLGPVEGIALSAAAGWAFDPTEEVQAFDGSVAVQRVALTVRGGELTAARVGDADATPGEPSAPIALALGTTELAVALTAGELTKTYRLAFHRGGARLAQAAYAKASNTGSPDNFGSAIAVSGDTLAIAAVGEGSRATGVDGDQADNTAGSSGAVYVFVRDGASWVQQAYLKASNTDADDAFGWALALDGDTLAVGATGEDSAATGVNPGGGAQDDDSAPFAGAVYVFARQGATWAQQAYLKASNAGAGDGFGLGVALDGDTLAVGAPAEASSATGVNPGGGAQADNSAAGAGAVYVFTRTGTAWSQQAYVKPPALATGNGFGTSVALLATASGATLAVGAPGESFRAGAVHVYTRSGAAWSHQARIVAGNADPDDELGSAVALTATPAGEVLAAAATGEDSAATGVDGNAADSSAPGAGAVYLFTRSGAAWPQAAYVKPSNTRRDLGFGSSLALAGDALAVGADRETSLARGIDGDPRDDAAMNAGAAYLFVRAAGGWQPHAYIKASNTGAFDRFGCAVALTDGALAIGALTESSKATGVNPIDAQNDNSASSSGAVYLFR